MKPGDLGLPPRFVDFRPQQLKAVWRTAQTDKRFIVHAMPTGSGKTLTYMAETALAADERFCVLTSTKGLADQNNREYESMKPADIRGQNNYICNLEGGEVTVDEGVCHSGVPCLLDKGGCDYFDAYRRATRARVVYTNYAYWLHTNTYGKGLGGFHHLVLDEAHAAPEHLASFLSIFVGHQEAERDHLGTPPEDPDDWRKWANQGLVGSGMRLQSARAGARRGERGKAKLAKHYDSQVQRLGMVARAQTDSWIMEEVWGGWRWDCVWPGAFAKKLLFNTGDRVSFFSATVRPKTMALLGLKKGEYEFWEYRSTFPADARRVIWIPTIKLSQKSSPSDIGRWLERIDQIVGGRRDRKGIIHTVSYERARLVVDFLRRRGWPGIVTHSPDTTAQAVAFYRSGPPGTVLVSPSLGTGYDFPYSQCEYQIIAKIPFPDRTSKIVQAREARDKDYGAYIAMTELVQAAGRGVRAEDDRCETFIIDDNWGWFKNAYRHFAPSWFMEAITRMEAVPVAPPRLAV